MKTMLSFIAFLSLLAGCASPAPTPGALMELPPDEIFEVRHSASVPAPVAYRNILEKARQCWERAPRIVDAESFSSLIGVARISVKALPETLRPGLTLVVVEVARDAEGTSRLIGRSLVATPARMGDLKNLRLWAEGAQVACS
jgi:hypothetical protein